MLLRILIGLFAGGALGALVGYIGKCRSGTCPITSTPVGGAVWGALIGVVIMLTFFRGDGGDSQLEISAEEFERLKRKTDQPLFVEFFATWCGPCKRLAPTIEALAEEYEGRARVVKIDVDHAKELAKEYGVTYIPAVRVFDDGRLVKKMGGADIEEYRKALDSLLAERRARGERPPDAEAETQPADGDRP